MMKAYEIAAVVAVILVIVLFLYFTTGKGDKRRLVLMNSEGKEVVVFVEVPNGTLSMAKGLMGRNSLPADEGMLFAFGKPGYHAFWMLNTTIPLDAIHISENGTVVDVIPMEPCGLNITRCRTYSPKAMSKYVLEVNQGFAEKNKIVPGKSALILS